MEKFNWLRQGGDYEIYQVSERFVLSVWGYAAEPRDCKVYVWTGDPDYTPEELPLRAQDGGNNWMDWTAFDFAEDAEGGPDWEDYASRLDDILEEIREYYSKPRRVSLDNGRNYYTADTIPAEELTGVMWEALVFYMDDAARERIVASPTCPDDPREFLAEYLKVAPRDLVIG